MMAADDRGRTIVWNGIVASVEDEPGPDHVQPDRPPEVRDRDDQGGAGQLPVRRGRIT